MSLLERIEGPDDLKVPAPGPAARPRGGDPALPRRGGLAHRRPPRAQPRRRRAHHRDPPGVQLTATTPWSSTPVTSPTCTSCSPGGTTSPGCAPRAGCPATRAAPSPSTTSSRTRTRPTSLSWAHGIAAGRVVQRPARPAHRGGHRRRRPHRRDGLGGPEQHRRRARPAARHRRQRQRALLRPDPRWPGRPPRDAAHDARLRALPRLGQDHPRAHAGRRRGDVRDAARGEEGHQGHRRAAGPVRGPRPEVPRPGRRPRRAGHRGRPAQGAGVRRAGARARAHPEGPRLRPRRQRRGRPVPRRRRHQPRDRAAPRDRRAQLDRRVQRRDGRDRRGAAPTSSRSPPR